MFGTKNGPQLDQWSEDVNKTDPVLEGLRYDSVRTPVFRTQLLVTTSVRTGGGPVSYVQCLRGGY